MPDVPAIYFCQPTEENLIRIGQDFSDGVYSSYYLNFISPISRQKMEDLALNALQAGCQGNIKKVSDYCCFFNYYYYSVVMHDLLYVRVNL